MQNINVMALLNVVDPMYCKIRTQECEWDRGHSYIWGILMWVSQGITGLNLRSNLTLWFALWQQRRVSVTSCVVRLRMTLCPFHFALHFREPAVFLLTCRQDSYIRSVVHAIESIVIQWSHQLQDFVERNSDQTLLCGLHPVPQTELKFWKERKDNLMCIYDQVNNFQYCMQHELEVWNVDVSLGNLVELWSKRKYKQEAAGHFGRGAVMIKDIAEKSLLSWS